MLRWLVTIAVVLLALPAWGQPATAPAAERAIAGKVDLLEGDVRIIDVQGGERRPQAGDAVHAGDTIVTGADGELHANMEDGGYIGVRRDTRMQIVDYRAEGGAEDRSIFSLLQGSFRSVTGWIGKYAARNYQVRTPTVTIGVRGTDHEPQVIPEGSALGEPGTYDKVNIGGTFMDSPHGRIEIGANQAGFAPHRRAARPQVLARVPAFFRATRNEARFQGRHEAVRQRVDRLREQRRVLIQERRGAAGKGFRGQGVRDGGPGAGGPRSDSNLSGAGIEARQHRVREQRRREFEAHQGSARSARQEARERLMGAHEAGDNKAGDNKAGNYKAGDRKAFADDRRRNFNSAAKHQADKAARDAR